MRNSYPHAMSVDHRAATARPVRMGFESPCSAHSGAMNDLGPGLQPATANAPRSAATLPATITRTVKLSSPRDGASLAGLQHALPLVDGRGISALSMAILRRPCVHRSASAKFSEHLADLEKETVDFIPNFRSDARRSGLLPSRIPNLLVKARGGFAVGMATNIPPHNLARDRDARFCLI